MMRDARRIVRLGLVCTLLLLPLLAGAGCDGRATEVKEAMTRLIEANDANDAETVASLYSRSTIQHYNDLLRLAREATREEITRMSLEQRLEVLGMRHTLSLAEMKKLDGHEFIKKCVREGNWAVEWGVEDYGSVKVTGSTGWMEVKEPDKRVTRAGRRWLEDTRKSFYIRFYLEDEVWKLDETSLYELWNVILTDEWKASRMAPDPFLLALLEDVYGKPASKSIWDPPKK